MIALPDAESLLAKLAAKMRASVTPQTALIGIHTGGVWVAQRLHDMLALAQPLGTIDVSFYRDDYGSRGLHAKVRPSAIPFEVIGADIILVDDVLHTGRTIRAAMNEVFDYGRPGTIRLAALVDRGGRQLPITAQFVGGEITVDDGNQIELVRDTGNKLGLKLNPQGAA